MRDTQRKGDIGVSQSIATFTKLGYDVSIPLTESAAYDLIVDDGELRRVQVRYTSNQNGEVDLRRIHSNSKGYVVKKLKTKAYDWLYILRDSGEEYLIKECKPGRRSIRPKENQKIVQPSL
ncbi:MAG: group I intron-associated PD-(D/E)XK endonuclease [Candidatus Saccharimonadales bacterium]